MKYLRKRKDLQSGQAMVLIALAFVGLAAFIGLATDAGILFSSVGSLRRAVDAAALSASNQFREGQTQSDIEASARQFIKINLASYDPILDDPPDNPCNPEDPESDCDIAVRVQTCENDVTLCPPGSPRKKLVRVEADMRVNLAFLPIIGYDWTVIRANAISEAGSVDLVLVIDTSPSMSYDLCKDGINNDEGISGELPDEKDDCEQVFPGTGLGSNGMPESDVQTCTDAPIRQNQCEPFETVREDARDLVGRMYFPYDRVAVVGFGSTANVILNLDECTFDPPNAVAQENCILDGIDNLEVELEPIVSENCPNWVSTGDPSGCTSTNTGDGLRFAGNLFADNDNDRDPDENDSREQAVWVVVLLSDGVANAAIRVDSSPPEWVCPPSTWLPPSDHPPYCQDGDPGPSLAPPRADNHDDFDADDHARKMALFVGCPNELPTDPADRGPCSEAGNEAVIFTIGLGDAVVSYDRGGDPEVGGELLQFIAAVADGLPGDDPCEPYGPDTDCGNYYFVEHVDELEAVFEEIASRIYTKLNH
jgi:hypothetical protein